MTICQRSELSLCQYTIKKIREKKTTDFALSDVSHLPGDFMSSPFIQTEWVKWVSCVSAANRITVISSHSQWGISKLLRLGVLSWSLNFGLKKKSWEIQLGLETKLFHNKVKRIFCLDPSGFGGFFSRPPNQENYGALQSPGKCLNVCRCIAVTQI